MSDLISRSALIEWLNEQREQVTKKQVAGTDGSIFTREALVTMQRCISTFETKVNNQPTAYDPEKVVAEIRNQPFGNYGVQEENEIIDIVKRGGVE